MNPINNIFNLEIENNRIKSAQLGNTTYPLYGRIRKDDSKDMFSTCRPLRFFFIKHAKITMGDQKVTVRMSHLKKMLGQDEATVKKILQANKGNLNRVFSGDKKIQECVRENLSLLAKKEIGITTEDKEIIYSNKKGKIRVLKKVPSSEQMKGSFKEIFKYAIDNNKIVAFAEMIPQETEKLQNTAREQTIEEYELGKKFYEGYLRDNPGSTPPFLKFHSVVNPSSDTPGFLMELCQDDLFNMIKDNLLTPQEKGKIFKEILYSIQHIHKENYVHRDIKLDNILIKKVDGNVSAKVIDFGFTVLSEDEGAFEQVSGSPYYMPPEYYLFPDNFELEHSKKIDSWALGVLLYTMHKGHYPDFCQSISDQSGKLAIYQEMRGMASLNDGSPIDIAIANLLNVDPAKRWSVDDAIRYFETLGDFEIGT